MSESTLFQLWCYGAGAVIFISIVGLGAILMIPSIKNHHGDVIQLLVGLAIGTLTSDALLHLLPHAFIEPSHGSDNHHHGDNHGHSHGADETAEMAKIGHGDHTRSVIYGLMSLMGIIGFLTFERVLTIISDLFSQSNRKSSKISNCNKAKHSNHNLTALNDNGHAAASELEKLNETIKMNDEKCKEAGDVAYMNGNANDLQLTTEQCHRETIVYQHPDPDKGYVVTLTDHHHHHQKQHQKGAKSVIMMIVTGDGMHNFFDGLAIGVAFAGGGVGGGLSTSVAILCHELPHEVGDFAVLLNAGLSTKRAVMYNFLSAVLCFIGMTVGVIVGKMDTGLLSSLIAGMFLYIALVNMIPQLDCCPTESGTTRALKLSIQLIGISIGVAIMSTISIYETNLQELFQ
ncbi:zinc transporter ZIP10-like [Panonychus citri]|uniref:zinc transporter ZIP10-like n=1 Tax=Panonychus citri TaxID=50023 RepID=UPI0023071337|nr:zinc transporter ZIP10-like [Panonychus citri]